jgi:hypothetical protein
MATTLAELFVMKVGLLNVANTQDVLTKNACNTIA